MKAWQWIAIGTGSVVLISLINRHRVMSNLKNNKLSENFNLSEFVSTATGLENIPGPVEVENLRALCQEVLQPLRNAVVKKYSGKKVSIVVSSGYRSPLVNQAVGGADTSQHLYGEASDINVYVNGVRLSNQEVIDEIRSLGLPYDQVIDEQLKGKQWVHVSHSKSKLRKQWLTARDGTGGKTVYATVQYG